MPKEAMVSSIVEKLVAIGIFLLFNVAIIAIAAEHPLRSLAAEWKTGSVRNQTMFDLGGVLGLSLLIALMAVLLAISQ